MKVLGIESSSLVASVALVEDEIVRAEYTVDFKKTHSQTLLPMLDELTRMLELDLHTVDAIAVAGGPGSFTGLRIGAATAKGLGLALKKPLIHVPTVDALAYNLWGASGLICPIMDARRSQVYTGLYRLQEGLEVVRRQCPMDLASLLSLLEEYGERVIFLGDGVPVYRAMIEERLGVPFAFAPAQMNRQRAASVAALGLEALRAEDSVRSGVRPLYRGARLVSADDFAPDYLRLSQAERQRAAELTPEGAAAKLPGDY